MFIPVCRHHFFEIHYYVLVDIQAQQCIQVPLRHRAAVVWLDDSQSRVSTLHERACHGGDQQQLVTQLLLRCNLEATCKTCGNKSSCPQTLFSVSSTVLGTFIQALEGRTRWSEGFRLTTSWCFSSSESGDRGIFATLQMSSFFSEHSSTRPRAR